MTEPEKKRKTVGVTCSIVRGVELRLLEPPSEARAAAGLPPATVGAPVALRGPSGVAAGVGAPGDGAAIVTEVDAEWFEKWLAQNGDNPLVKSGAIAKAE